MLSTCTSGRVRAVCWGLLAALGAGCGNSNSGYDRYVPSSDTARTSLEAALTAWQNGQPPGKIETVSPPLQVVDAVWQRGRKLRSFLILSEETGDGPHWFSVRLTFTAPNSESVVRYVVLGRDPIWVYREEDYKRATGM